ncbi:MAG: nucleoside hydrolase [Anaerolineae bacterium]|nr:nucleoside hydrolase [Anaerolineae bacterium]
MEKTKIILDVDMGIDDAAALAWLLEQDQAEVTGIATVAGNTTPENSAKNALSVLATAGRTDIEVAVGAAEPLQQVASRISRAIHGPDGLWLAGTQDSQNTNSLSRDVVDFYRRQIERAGAGVTIVAMGPLTNLALLAKAYPDIIQCTRIIAHGGSRERGSRTPNASFNIWFDPEAAARVLAAGSSLTLIAGTKKFALSRQDIDALHDGGTAPGRFLAAPLRRYADAQAQQGRIETFAAPDVVAAVYTIEPSVGEVQPALVRIAHGIFETDVNRLLRGKVTIGVKLAEKLPMIADDIELSALADHLLAEPSIDLQAELQAILAREPDNAQVVLDIDAARIHELFMRPFIQTR